MIVELVCLLSILLILCLYLRFSGYRIKTLEKFDLTIRGKRRRKEIEERVRSYRVEDRPYLRTAVVVSAVLLLLILSMTHKLFWAVVISDSMRPTMKRGDIILMQAIYIDPHVGDIIMFRVPNFYLPVTHRVVKIEGKYIYTAGDASGPDPWVITRKDIIAQAVTVFGRPIVIPGVGKYFILNAEKLKSIGPFGEEYWFYKNLIRAFKNYALAIVIICTAAYVYLEMKS